jgi:hypothetical protein
MSALPHPVLDPLCLQAEDVTGTKLIEFDDVDGHRLVSEVALSLAQEMNLPPNTPWALRDDTNARMLNDDRPLGSQVEQNARLTVVPKSHLGRV